ncbi:Eukaryotic translation initiation factor 2A [Sphaceloma murrayae]|uniref:Eukaryotic translation initiation factor 2A n=1 Tax=Sphaceloma murrayae TaxID=2082308 RepID=A0A2K1R2A4_9PEZI|nr:Eukaryotic translation initiation factor 2A [Sphaceloma murrayae]
MTQTTQLAYRTAKHIGILDATPVYQPLSGFEQPEGNLRCATYSPDGRFFAWASPERVNVVDAASGHVATILPAENVFELGFSPLGTYIITWQRPTKDEAGNAVKNLKVWRTLDDGAGEHGERTPIGQYVQKSQTGWNLQYTADEKLCARCVTNEVQFYESHDLGTTWNRLRVEGVSDFAVSPGGQNISVAVFTPERKGQPASVKVFRVPQFTAPVSQKTFFKGDKVQLKWNQEGTSVIVLAQTEVDKTNKSYYGETNMYILSANGGFDSRITLDKEGPIHDVSWSPNSKEFGVVYGYMPAKTTIFNARAVATKEFPTAPRNTINFSPHGRFVLIAGFGNLQGDVDIYDLEKNYNKVCTIKASNASICEWAPDGKHILTATTSPRLRVDNGVKIYHVGGSIMYVEDMTELYNVYWRPRNASDYPLGDPFNPAPTPHESAVKYLGTVKTPSKPVGAYRPPGARGTSTPLAFKREDEGGAAFVRDGISSTGTSAGVNGFGKPRRREVPGAETVDQLPPGAAPGGGVSLAGTGEEGLSKAALKNKKKRENKKAKDAEIQGPNGNLAAPSANGHAAPARSPERRDRPRSRSKTDQDGARTHSRRREGSKARGAPRDGAKGPAIQTRASAAAPPVPVEAPDLTVTSPGGGSSQDKKVRALHKKLRAIDDLKMRQAGGEKLEATQVQKISTEDSVRKELAALNVVE